MRDHVPPVNRCATATRWSRRATGSRGSRWHVDETYVKVAAASVQAQDTSRSTSTASLRGRRDGQSRKRVNVNSHDGRLVARDPQLTIGETPLHPREMALPSAPSGGAAP